MFDVTIVSNAMVPTLVELGRSALAHVDERVKAVRIPSRRRRRSGVARQVSISLKMNFVSLFVRKMAATLTLTLMGALLGSGVTAAAIVPLGAATSFAVLGSSTVTNTGSTTIVGDLGLSPGTSVTGFPPGTVTGTTHAADATASSAQHAGLATFNSLVALSHVDESGSNLGNRTLTPGAYFWSDSTALLDGTLTLNAENNPNALFIFQLANALVAGSVSAATVNVMNGGANVGVYWDIGSSATLNGLTTFAGNILADQSISMLDGTSLCGRAIALNGAVTVISSVISNNCSDGVGPGDFGSNGFSGNGVSGVPELGTWAMMIIGFVGVGMQLRRRSATA